MKQFVTLAPGECKSLESVRDQIDLIDQKIIEAIALRFEYVKEVVKYKNPNPESIIAPARYESVIANRRLLAIEYGLDPSLIENIYRLLLNHFIEKELELIKR